MSLSLDTAVKDVQTLTALFVTAMPDCLLFDSWVREESEFNAEDAAAYFGDLIRANREGLKALGSWSSEMQVTIESADKLIILREISESFVASAVFDRGVPLGMARLHLNRLLDRIATLLPKFDTEERPRGVRLIEFLHRYAPDPHSVLMRASLRTGLTIDQLEHAERLSPEDLERLEEASRSILGLKTLNI